MTKYEFKELILRIGFKKCGHYYDEYRYKDFVLFLHSNNYHLLNYSYSYQPGYDDLIPINYYFKNEMRSIKLKNILR